jgi:hypothetical protein
MMKRLSSQNSQFRIFLYWFLAALLVGLLYVLMSSWGFGFTGFPLDDAWIHQTYARNLAQTGQLAFVPGLTSAGSTAPLWSVLLSLGYLLGVPFRLWTYGLGILLLALTGWTMARLGSRLFPKRRWVGLLAGLFCLFEWHLAWAAVSGMETILFVWLSVLLVERYLANDAAAGSSLRPAADLGLGLLGGLLILTRPEGLGLVGLIGLDMAYRGWSVNSGSGAFVGPLMKRWVWLSGGVGLLLGPYLLFHLWLTGLPLPNTFYAKQAEYGLILNSFPLWWRLFGNFGPPVDTVQGVFRVVFIGAQLLLIPGLLLAAWLTIKERRSTLWFVWVWWLSYLLLYGLRLPVTYQHGRYQIPAIPWIILLGVWGTVRLVDMLLGRGVVGRAVGRVLVISLLILTPVFTLIGAQAYGRDVRIIETEMVVTARWLAEHTDPGALLAVHDIGAIGYYTQRPLIDLAGLITPEIIPIIRDEAALLDFIEARQAEYLVTFPSWYPELTAQPGLQLIYSTDAPWAPQAGGDNMAVYRIGM